MKNILRVVKRLGLSRAQKHLNRIRSKTSHLAVLMGDQWSQIHVEEPESDHFRHQVITLNQLTIQSLKYLHIGRVVQSSNWLRQSWKSGHIKKVSRSNP